MDENGFIFTGDATLALIVVIVITASIVIYAGLPIYQGEDHQHLESLAASALNTMEQDGTINNAVVQASFNNSTSNQTAQDILKGDLDTIIPVGIGYRITIGNYPYTVEYSNNNGANPYSFSKDVATSVKVVSGPQAGWIGRAWYKQENVSFIDEPTNVTTTLANFHNYLTNYYRNGWYSSQWAANGLYNQPYWGTSSSSIPFSIPNGATINGGMFLLGSVNRYSGNSYDANVEINNNPNTNSNPFTFLTSRGSTYFYNYQGNISAGELYTGSNSFYVNFLNMNSLAASDWYNDMYDMPWFSLIGNYTTTLPVPNGTITNRTYFDDAAGLANPSKDSKNSYGVQYYLNNGTVKQLTAADGYPRNTLTWNDILNHDFKGQDDGRPYDIVGGFPSGSGISHGSALTVEKTISIPSDATGILDAYVVLNIYGGTDDAVVEVFNGTTWQTAFNSLGGSNSGVTHSTTGGYGDIPGILYIQPYLSKGQNNIVRVTFFDQVPSQSGNDYDLVGIVNSYVQISYTRLQNKWDTYPEYGFPNYQTNDNQNVYSHHEPFSVSDDAKKVIMFLGVGTNTQNVKVTYYPSEQVLYNGPVQFYLDLAAIDAKMGYHVITTANSTENSYYLKNVTDQNIEVTVTASPSWQSGDGGSSPQANSNAEIFSGTRVAVLYPQTLQNIWNVAYANDATTAKNIALQNLIAEIHVSPNDPGLGSEALYTGNMPNSVPVRLELWKQ